MATSSSLFSLSPPTSLSPKPPPTHLPSFSPLSLSSSSSPPPPRSHILQYGHGSSLITPKDPSLSSDLQSVICPSLAFANMVFFKSTFNVQVDVGEDEPEEVLVSRFRREVFRAGVIQEVKRRRFFENMKDKKKRKSQEAAKRNRRRRPQPKAEEKDKQEASKKVWVKYSEEDDNWDLVDVEVPYC
ncbi:30S ribosomal protein S21, chloroplastic-like [Actinidia eriantha]|uniref:30S ribosomal protein S21, chloroplastic-like n=1 Tax=Actinidia eriantha TaxID=165200 RepID=UPI00258A74AF|nr:30S ribosomal protein S21, chloroplastic-like [Actinidia eriantha]